MEAHLYDELARNQDSHWWFIGRRAVVGAVLERQLPAVTAERRRLLDVGCGTGGMLELLSRFGDVEGLEGADEALRLCRERVGDTVRLRKGRIPEDVPADGSYDVVTMFDVLEHLEDPVTSLSAIRKALKPEGRLVLTVPAFQFLWSAHDEAHHHFRRYTQTLLSDEVEQAGFQVKWSSYFNSLLFPPVAAVRLLQKLRRQEPSSDLGPSAGALGKLLEGIFSAERFIVPWMSLPAGVSLAAVAVPAPSR